jgi:hypothetical protein
MQFISKESNTYGVSFPGSIFSLSLSIFRAFISALEGNAVKITDSKLTEFEQLCEAFGFSDFATKPSKSCDRSEDSQELQIGSLFARMQSSLLSEFFVFIVNGFEIELSVAESAVGEQLSVDGCARKFFL